MPAIDLYHIQWVKTPRDRKRLGFEVEDANA